jgi:hypothetical protein
MLESIRDLLIVVLLTLSLVEHAMFQAVEVNEVLMATHLLLAWTLSLEGLGTVLVAVVVVWEWDPVTLEEGLTLSQVVEATDLRSSPSHSLNFL